MRKEAFKLVQRREATLAEALKRVAKDSELKEAFFITPIALSPGHGGGEATQVSTLRRKK